MTANPPTGITDIEAHESRFIDKIPCPLQSTRSNLEACHAYSTSQVPRDEQNHNSQLCVRREVCTEQVVGWIRANAVRVICVELLPNDSNNRSTGVVCWICMRTRGWWTRTSIQLSISFYMSTKAASREKDTLPPPWVMWSSGSYFSRFYWTNSAKSWFRTQKLSIDPARIIGEGEHSLRDEENLWMEGGYDVLLWVICAL